MKIPSDLWLDIISVCESRAENFFSKEDQEIYSQQLHSLNQLAIFYACDYIKNKNLFTSLNSPKTIAQLCLEGRIPSQYERAIRRLLEIGVSVGLLDRVGDKVYVRTKEWIEEISAKKTEELRQEFTESTDLFEFVFQLGKSLSDVLDGRIHAAELLFAGGLTEIASRLYTDTTPFYYCNTIAAEALSEIVRKSSCDRSLHILEVGAGTGATTNSLVPIVQNKAVSYLFTDISNFFLIEAKKTYKNKSFMQYSLLNIEDSPNESIRNKYDVVIAAHVLHATKNIEESLRNVKSLLAKRGFLILLEETTMQPFFSVTMGMQTGFDRFDDSPMRTLHPLLTAKQWEELALRVGFSHVKSFPEIMGIRPILIQK